MLDDLVTPRKTASDPPTELRKYLGLWGLVPDGEVQETRTSLLMPVRRQHEPGMLKLARESEEHRAGKLMAWWQGEGAVRVLAEADGVLLLERAMGPRSLAAMARAGGDDEATRILCAVTRRLHGHAARPPDHLVPLEEWFGPLLQWVGADKSIAQGRAVAIELLTARQERVVLHGDIHHENVLDGGPRGWLAIDPKGLWGDRAFDFVNILRNPDDKAALVPGRFLHRVERISQAAGLDRDRLLRWTLAFASLSAVWILGDGDEPVLDLAVARLASAALRV